MQFRAPGNVSRNNPMAAVIARADNDHDNVLAALLVRKPPCEQFRGAEARTAAHLVGIG
jgi:hypothetical protein